LGSDDPNRKNTSIENASVFHCGENVVRTTSRFFSIKQADLYLHL